MDFVSQFMLANSGTMIPARFLRWSAFSLLAMTMGRKIYIDHEHFVLHPSMYICLVGEPATRKTSAKDRAKDMYTEVFPDTPIGASVMSREMIVDKMAKECNLRTYEDEEKSLVEFRPMNFFINELHNFMSVNPQGMVEFLTDIYDTKFFASETLKHGLQPLINPCINILACDTPTNITGQLKANVIGGGFSRRMNWVYETVLPEKRTFPTKSKEAFLAEDWCKEHLSKINKIAGPIKWTDEAKDILDKWYRAIPNSDNALLQGYYGAKDMLAQKIGMCLALAKPEPDLVFDADLIRLSITRLEANEDNLVRLSLGAGSNRLAIPQQKLLDRLFNEGGEMPEKRFHRYASADLNEMEYRSVIQMLKGTDQIHEVTLKYKGGIQSIILTHEVWMEKKAKGEIV